MNHASLSAYQLADAFPEECREYIPKVLDVLKAKIRTHDGLLQAILDSPIPQKQKHTQGELLWRTHSWQIPAMTERIETYSKALELVRQHKPLKWLDDRIRIDVANAKPIETLHGFEGLRMTSTRIVALCPFHDEKTGSFVIYRRDNTFHCFGCKVSGDAIKFMMKLNKLQFPQAVEALQ